MNPASPSPAPRRRVWLWVLLAAGLCLSPFLLLGAAAVSYLTLDSDVRTLRRHVMAATDAEWCTRAQVSVGRLTLGAIGQGLRFVDHEDMPDARLAIRAVKHASVGVYERTSPEASWSREDLFVKTDRAMRQRGWSRLVGVADRNETVLVYVADDFEEDEPVEICLAVVNGKKIVVASTRLDARAVSELVVKHAKGDDLKRQLRLSKLRF